MVVTPSPVAAATTTAWRVVVTRRIPEAGMALLRGATPPLDLVVHDSDDPMPRDVLLAALPGADAILCVLTDSIDFDALSAAGPSLKVVSTLSVGYNHIDLDAVKALPQAVSVGYTPEVLSDTVADLAVGLALATCRRFKEATAAVTDGSWGTWQPLWMCGVDLHHSTVGIVGLGRIGYAVARRLRGFDCNIVYTSRSDHPTAAADLGAKRVPLDELLTTSDFIIPMCPATPETRGMFDAAAFAKMKNSAVFINAARGELVNQRDLIAALKTGQIYAAGLDVTTPEPLPVDSELNRLPNCYIIPHIASATNDTRSAMSVLAARNLLAAYAGKPMLKQIV
jgi:glyoxylate/hydroxypyruvate reductase